MRTKQSDTAAHMSLLSHFFTFSLFMPIREIRVVPLIRVHLPRRLSGSVCIRGFIFPLCSFALSAVHSDPRKSNLL